MAVPVTRAETESEWETDEDVIEAKPEEAKLEDALAKLDMLDLDSDDEKRHSVYTNKVAAKEEMKVLTAPTVVVEAPTAATTNGFENLRVPFGVVSPPQPSKTSGVHYKEEPEVAEEAKEEEAEEEEEVQILTKPKPEPEVKEEDTEDDDDLFDDDSDDDMMYTSDSISESNDEGMD